MTDKIDEIMKDLTSSYKAVMKALDKYVNDTDVVNIPEEDNKELVVHSLCEAEGSIYAATSQGVYCKSPYNKEFKKVPIETT